MSASNIYLLQFKIQRHLLKRVLWMPVHKNSFRRKRSTTCNISLSKSLTNLPSWVLESLLVVIKPSYALQNGSFKPKLKSSSISSMLLKQNTFGCLQMHNLHLLKQSKYSSSFFSCYVPHIQHYLWVNNLQALRAFYSKVTLHKLYWNINLFVS